MLVLANDWAGQDHDLSAVLSGDFSQRRLRYERESKAGPDFRRQVDDDLGPVLRNIKNAAIVYDYLTFKRDLRPLMTTPSYSALQLCLRQGSIHPTTLTP
jgi:hypothetical protein